MFHVDQCIVYHDNALDVYFYHCPYNLYAMVKYSNTRKFYKSIVHSWKTQENSISLVFAAKDIDDSCTPEACYFPVTKTQSSEIWKGVIYIYI